MGKVVCFGELLLRLSLDLNREWVRSSSLQVFIGGAELNVATALAKWNIPVKYLTALPVNFLSDDIIAEISRRAIDINSIYFNNNRLGTYYLQQQTDLKHSSVVYDRANSAFASLKPSMINWEKELADCTWLHFSAISPSLTQDLALVCKEAVEFASTKGIEISVDLNYRNQLWQYGIKPIEIMPELVKRCTKVMGNIWSVENLLGVESSIKQSEGKTTTELTQAANKSIHELFNLFPNLDTIAYTFRLDSNYFGVVSDHYNNYKSKEYSLNYVVDKVGSGDCFMAGLIYGFANKLSLGAILDFATAAAFGKLHESGDHTNQTIEQVIKTTRS